MAERLVGIDIGSHAVRAVVLVRSAEGWAIASHAALPRRDAAGEPRPLSALLSELDTLVGLRRGAVTVADSTHPVLVRFLATIPMPPDRMAKLLRLELAQHADGGELAADVYPVPLSGDEIIHGSAMAQPATVRGLLADLARANVRVRRVHFGGAALFNALLPAPPLGADDLALLVDIGAAGTRVALAGPDRLLAFRQLTIGGEEFTKALAQARGIAHAKAEQFKQHWALTQAAERAKGAEKAATLPAGGSAIAPAADATAPTVPDDDDFELLDEHGAVAAASSTAATVPAESGERKAFDNLFGDDDDIEGPGSRTMEIGGATLGADMTRVAETLYTQLASSIGWFGAQLQTDRPKVTKVLLCGGGAALTGLAPYLQRRFALAVETWDPCAQLAGAKPEVGAEFATAIGLALSELPEAVRLDLLPEAEVRRRLWRERLAWPFVAAAAVVLAAGLGAWTLLAERAATGESLDNIARYKSRHEEMSKQLVALQAERDALGEDLKAIASRIYFNRDVLYVIRVLKEQAPLNAELWVTRLETEKLEPPKPERTAFGQAPARKAEPTVVERGAIVVEGRIKFEKERKPDEQEAFFRNYQRAVENSPAGGDGPLFDTAKTKVLNYLALEDKPGTVGPTQPKSKPQQPAGDGSTPFGFRLFFLPMRLDRAIGEIPSTASPARPAPAKDEPAKGTP